MNTAALERAIESKSTTEIFRESHILFRKINDGDVEGDIDEAYKRCFQLLEELRIRIRREDIFSSNECTDDINTEDLPLLATEFMIGILLVKMPFSNHIKRISMLDEAESLLDFFLTNMNRLQLLSKLDSIVWRNIQMKEGVAAAAPTREEKIATYRNQQQIEKTRNTIKTEIDAMSNLSHGIDETEYTSRVSELNREYNLLCLKMFGSEALNELFSLWREKEMLKKMSEYQTDKYISELDKRMKEKNVPTAGLTVTHVSNFNGKLDIKKEVIKGQVFRPTVAPPTMTLEEFGQKEMERAIEREEKEKNAPQLDKRYNELVEAGEEDDIDLVDRATSRDRDWDDWKDDHPRGYGNKANKRF